MREGEHAARLRSDCRRGLVTRIGRCAHCTRTAPCRAHPTYPHPRVARPPPPPPSISLFLSFFLMLLSASTAYTLTTHPITLDPIIRFPFNLFYSVLEWHYTRLQRKFNYTTKNLPLYRSHNFVLYIFMMKGCVIGPTGSFVILFIALDFANYK